MTIIRSETIPTEAETCVRPVGVRTLHRGILTRQHISLDGQPHNLHQGMVIDGAICGSPSFCELAGFQTKVSPGDPLQMECQIVT
jgi:hypothetical protein